LNIIPFIVFVFVTYPFRGVGTIAHYAFNGRTRRQSATKLLFSCH